MSAHRNPPLSSFSTQDALVAVMVGVSASDENMTTKELLSISRMVDTLPVFDGYDRDRLRTVSQTVFDLLTEEDGLDALFGLVRDALPRSAARDRLRARLRRRRRRRPRLPGRAAVPARTAPRDGHRPAARRRHREGLQRPPPPPARRRLTAARPRSARRWRHAAPSAIHRRSSACSCARARPDQAAAPGGASRRPRDARPRLGIGGEDREGQPPRARPLDIAGQRRDEVQRAGLRHHPHPGRRQRAALARRAPAARAAAPAAPRQRAATSSRTISTGEMRRPRRSGRNG